MNREILFRGRRLDNGEWAEGFYFCRDTQHYIKVPVVRNGVVVLTDYEVNPDTIGQFTGLLDKNGKRVFEGDTLGNPQGSIWTVKWHDGQVQWWLIGQNGAKTCPLCRRAIEFFEVIGNIHDKEEVDYE